MKQIQKIIGIPMIKMRCGLFLNEAIDLIQGKVVFSLPKNWEEMQLFEKLYARWPSQIKAIQTSKYSSTCNTMKYKAFNSLE